MNRFLKHGHHEHSNRGAGAFQGEEVDEVSGRNWLTIHMEAIVQAHCMTWLFAYIDVSWVVHGGPRSQVPCSGRDAMEVWRGQGHMQASLGYGARDHHSQSKCRTGETTARASILPCAPALIWGGLSGVDLGGAIGC